jgi:hypothetical protein
LEDSEDNQAQPSRGEGRTDNVELRRVFRPWRGLHSLPREEDDEHDDDPDKHERRHHERVRGDGELDAGDRRVEIGHDLRDRDVHDARVEHITNCAAARMIKGSQRRTERF